LNRIAANAAWSLREVKVAELRVIPLERIGARIEGIDWAKPVSDRDARHLYGAWLDSGVLVFPRAATSTEIHLKISLLFGELEEHPLKALHVSGSKELIYFGGEEQKGKGTIVDGQHLAGFLYAHQDTAYTPNLCRGGALRMIQVPEDGGDTIWYDTAKAYQDLPDELKCRLETLSTIVQIKLTPPVPLWGQQHRSARAVDPKDLETRGIPILPPVVHPMVITHPESKLKSLLISPSGYVRILELDQAESDALFEQLVSHAMKPAYQYRHRWSVDDLVLWDNRRTMHMATGYPHHQSRLAYRTTLKGHMPTGRLYREKNEPGAPLYSMGDVH
jgi:taurine dioxygenase